MRREPTKYSFAVGVALTVICTSVRISAGAPFGIERVSISSEGQQANARSSGGAMSADGRYAAFASNASNLVPGDTNGVGDVFVRDRLMGITERVSVNSDGEEGNGFSSSPSISADGRYVAFASGATNLAPFDLNGKQDVFVHDRSSHTTIRVSIGSTGRQGDGDSHESAISADGRFVAFRSFASNFAENDTNNTSDIFVHDILTETTEIVNVDNDGTQFDGAVSPSISGDGRLVAFADAGAQDQIYIRDRFAQRTRIVSVNRFGQPGSRASQEPRLSSDGQLIAFLSYSPNLVEDDTNGLPDIFLSDTGGAMIQGISVSPAGSQANGSSTSPAITADGQLVAFLSDASNLVANDTNGAGDIFVYDTTLSIFMRVSVSGTGDQANDRSFAPFLSGDGSAVGFVSLATNFVPGDTNGDWDVFVASLRVPTSTPTPSSSPTPTMTSTRSFTSTRVPISCAGDCDKNATVTVDELVRGVNMALGTSTAATGCSAFDLNSDGNVTVDELIAAVNRALGGCD